MKVVSPAEFSWVSPLARPVAAGEVVEVDDRLGAQLVDQGWKAAPSKNKKSAGAERPDVAASAVPEEEQ